MNRRSENYFNLGLYAYEGNHPEQSIRFFKKSLEFPNDRDQKINAVINIAQIYDEMDQNAQCLHWYQYLVDQYQCEEGYYGLAMIHEKIGNEEEAIYYYRKAIEKNDAYRDAIFFLANLYDKRCEFEQSIAMYEMLVEKIPDDYMAYNNLGSIHEELGNFEMAKKYLLESLQCRDDYFRSHFNLGIVYKKLSDHAAALKEYEIAKNLNPHCSDIYLNMALIYKEKRDYKKSLQILTRGIEIAPSANLYYNRACIFALLKKQTDAKRDLKQAFQQNEKLISYAKRDPEIKNFINGDSIWAFPNE